MAASRRRPTRSTRSKAVSYKEPSSDVEPDAESHTSAESSDEPTTSRRPPKRTPAIRSSNPPQRSSRKRQRVAISYREMSTDDDSGPSSHDDDTHHNSDGEEFKRKRTRTRTRTVSREKALPAARTTRARSRTLGSYKAKSQHLYWVRLGAFADGRAAIGEATFAPPPLGQPTTLESDRIVPAWHTLPYEILLQIFEFASYPLVSEYGWATTNVSWLLNAARTCRAFAEPALTALYRCPPLGGLGKPHQFLEAISHPANTRMYNYNVKVRRLELDARISLAYAASGLGLFDLGALIPHLPQLSEICIFDPTHLPHRSAYQKSGPPLRWHYSENLFTSLETSGTRLKAWTWDASVIDRDRSSSFMQDTHQKPCFQTLKKLSFCDFHASVKNAKASTATTVEEQLAATLESLPNLKSLAFVSSSVITDKSLPSLPDDLVTLHIINCNGFTSEAMHVFLSLHGRQLKELVLNHNQSLDIAFFTDLGTTCPSLEVLKMDLNYYNTHTTSQDSDPKYVDLLKPDEVPSWPSTLQTLELLHLRKWTSEAAEHFFASLIDSAENLPDLRRLVIHAILNISWRDRAGFRDLWIGRLERVFLRKSSPPNPHLASLKAFRLWKQSQRASTPLSDGGQVIPSSDADYPRKPSPAVLITKLAGLNSDDESVMVPRRTPIQANKETSLPTPEENSNEEGSWGKRRLRPRAKFYAETASSDEDDSDKLSGAEADKVSFVQGLCQVVDIRIDNLRPRDTLYREQDFLDEERSGDEDWNGNDEIPGSGHYAW